MDAAFEHFSDQEQEQEQQDEIIKSGFQHRKKRKHIQQQVVHEKLDKELEIDLKKSRKLDEFETSVEKNYQINENDQFMKSDENQIKETLESGEIKTETQLKVRHQVRHQVALPLAHPNYIPITNHVPLKDPPRVWPFTLDPFQVTAIHSIERGESVLVSAHTSAGKTVVAEYAIATCLKQGQRVIYTSPIKALSNQKYRDLLAEFGDVGLMTGDVTINPTATCLVMTTEILRSMLYRGSEIMREVAWVIFDEIHYMRDSIRGVVWEETLILLPDKVHFVFLSATIPNAMQFAEWICSIKNQPCHVVYTDYRPTPLQHYLFPMLGDGIHLVVDEKSNFREDNFQKAIASLGEEEKGKGKRGRDDKKKDKSTSGTSDLYKILKMIYTKNYQPVIVFSFSKRQCENNAMQISKLDFNTNDEKALVKSIFGNAIQSLGEDDRELPQIEHLLPLLCRGIGIHHSGLLPILKEVIEILFQEGLLKVLFATETFSIGLNMPAKTVVFTSVRKFDGTEQRWLTGGEYIQMSGRAGRRGLDARGVVILMIDLKMEPDVAKGMLKGVSDALNSAFHLTYTMILNLMRVDGGVTHEYMLQNSFHQFQNSDKIPELNREISVYQKRMDAIEIEHFEIISDFYQVQRQLELYTQDVRKVITDATYCLPFIQPGRLLHIKRKSGAEKDEQEHDFGWGVVLDFEKVVSKQRAKNSEPAFTHLVQILLHCRKNTPYGVYLPAGAGQDERDGMDIESEESAGEMVCVPCSLESIANFSSVRLNLPKEIKSKESRTQMYRTLVQVEAKFKGKLPMLDPIKDMRITDEGFKKFITKIGVLKERLDSSEIGKLYASDVDVEHLLEQYESKIALEAKISLTQSKVRKAESILQMDELKSRFRVLRRLGYTNENDIIDMKGRVACEISAGDELVLTEMIFNGVFNDLSPEQTTALLSCFVCSDRSEKTDMKPELAKILLTLKDTARRVAQVSNECKITLDLEEYVDSFRPELMSCAYAWSLGAKFHQICKMTDIFEGSIIRSMRRLEELLQQLITASKVIGNTELESKFEACSTSIKRDIVFAQSLYL